MDRKFNVNGREVHWCYLNNDEILKLVKDENTTDEDREFLNNYLLDKFERECCTRPGEGEEELFARNFGNFVNGKCHNKKTVANTMGREHRYLQQEMFKVCLEYIKLLAENCEKNYYDPRNEWACKASKHMLEGLKAADYWY